MLKILIIGLGGFLGAISRYGLAGLTHKYLNGSFPFGTLAVNLVGCLLIGGLMYIAQERQLLSPETRLFVFVGFLGSFTTLSTVGYETFEFLRAHDFSMAIVNAGANGILCIAAVVLGWVAVKAVSI